MVASGASVVGMVWRMCAAISMAVAWPGCLESGVQVDLTDSEPSQDAGQDGPSDAGDDSFDAGDLVNDGVSDSPTDSAIDSTDSGADVGGDRGDDGSSEDVADASDVPDDAPDVGGEGAVRYPADRIHSPVTPNVAERWWAIAANGDALQDDVFMKVGASSTVNANNLFCFDGGDVDLGEAEELEDAWQFFLAGDAAGVSPFARVTDAAEGGVSTSWALDGHLDDEVEAIQPRFALIHYGTNDMGQAATYAAALDFFGENLWDLRDQLVDVGVLPILVTIFPRDDVEEADYWVPTFNGVIRALAQDSQTPLLDMHLAVVGLPGRGLGGDGLHPSVYRVDGVSKPCWLTEEGREYGYNQRNLRQLEAVDRTWRVVVEGESNLDAGEPVVVGSGTADDPFEISEMPFSHSADTSDSVSSQLDVYSGCGDGQDESGPEWVYHMHLSETTRVRAALADRGDSDVDVHLLEGGVDAGACLERGHRHVDGTLGPGDYYWVLDTFVDGGGALPGPYLFVVHECDAADVACDDTL